MIDRCLFPKLFFAGVTDDALFETMFLLEILITMGFRMAAWLMDLNGKL
jgi:hypothetical protein